jgi:cytochrome c oxidase subunit 2
MLSLFVMSACAGSQSALDPRGVQADRIYRLFNFMVGTATLVWVLVMLVLLWALFRRRGERAIMADVTHTPLPDEERAMHRGTTWGVAATVLIIFAFLIADLRTGHALTSKPPTPPLSVEVKGHQWWWEFRYADPVAGEVFSTANELHVPVGRPVLLTETADDVIHSLWIPNLHGKKDLIPGKTTTTWFRADSAGYYRGQCAEFCGYQHAHMAFDVVAQSPAEFAHWAESQRKSADSTQLDSAALHGQHVFTSAACANCHTIRGTSASGNVAPDLTHLASRLTIGAGTLPNNRGNLGGWIVNPQGIKPGTRMPPNQLEPYDLQALLTYLQGLK